MYKRCLSVQVSLALSFIFLLSNSFQLNLCSSGQKKSRSPFSLLLRCGENQQENCTGDRGESEGGQQGYHFVSLILSFYSGDGKKG